MSSGELYSDLLMVKILKDAYVSSKNKQEEKGVVVHRQMLKAYGVVTEDLDDNQLLNGKFKEFFQSFQDEFDKVQTQLDQIKALLKQWRELTIKNEIDINQKDLETWLDLCAYQFNGKTFVPSINQWMNQAHKLINVDTSELVQELDNAHNRAFKLDLKDDVVRESERSRLAGLIDKLLHYGKAWNVLAKDFRIEWDEGSPYFVVENQEFEVDHLNVQADLLRKTDFMVVQQEAMTFVGILEKRLSGDLTNIKPRLERLNEASMDQLYIYSLYHYYPLYLEMLGEISKRFVSLINFYTNLVKRSG